MSGLAKSPLDHIQRIIRQSFSLHVSLDAMGSDSKLRQGSFTGLRRSFGLNHQRKRDDSEDKR